MMLNQSLSVLFHYNLLCYAIRIVNFLQCSSFQDRLKSFVYRDQFLECQVRFNLGLISYLKLKFTDL